MNDELYAEFERLLSQKYRKVVGKQPKKTSRYIGVSWDRKNKKWKARKWNKKHKRDYNRGYFKSEYLAAQYVNVACDELNEEWDNPEVGVHDVIRPKKGRKPTPR